MAATPGTPATLTESYYPADESDVVLDTTVGGILREAAEAAPDTLALVGGHPDPADRRRWTYGELLGDAERCARALLARFQPGERVAAWAPNLPQWEIVELGAAPYDLVVAGDPRTSADLVSAAGLAAASRYADAVGLEKCLIIPRDATGRLLGVTPVARQAHDVGLEVFGWTFRRENRFLPLDFRRGTDPAAPGDLAGEIAVHLAAGMDSVITDHPDLARVPHPAAVPVAA